MGHQISADFKYADYLRDEERAAEFTREAKK